jgi:hypothetical protein
MNKYMYNVVCSYSSFRRTNELVRSLESSTGRIHRELRLYGRWYQQRTDDRYIHCTSYTCFKRASFRFFRSKSGFWDVRAVCSSVCLSILKEGQ